MIVTGGDGEVLGILSERDIVRAVGRYGPGALQEPVSKHMTSKVVTTRMEEAIDQVMEQMTSGVSAICRSSRTGGSRASSRSATSSSIAWR